MMDQLPLCFSVRQPEGNQCWYDASTMVDSVGSTATDIAGRESIALLCDWEMVAESNPHPGRNYGLINLCEPDKFKGTHPDVVHPQQVHTASSVGGTEANSTGRVSLECGSDVPDNSQQEGRVWTRLQHLHKSCR